MNRPARPRGLLWSTAALGRALVAAVTLVDLLVLALVRHTVLQDRELTRERAVIGTQNLASALESYLVGVIDKVDLGVLAVRDEYERQVASGRVDAAAMEAFIARQRERVGVVDAFRVADPTGDVVHGFGSAARPNIADRAYFARLRDSPGAGLVISQPIVGRVTAKPQIVVARRLADRDGAFSGVVLAAIALDEIAATFASFDVGQRGVIVLRGEDLGLIVRHQLHGAPVALGSRVVSPQLEEVHRAGQTQASYGGVAVDGIERTFSVRRLPRYPFYVIVGLAFDDYLGDWRRGAIVALSIAAAFVVLTAAAAWLVFRSWRRREAAAEALAEQETKLRLLAENATDAIWRVDPHGRLTYVSPAVEKLLGYRPDEAMALPREHLFTAATLETFARHREEIARAAPFAQPFAGAVVDHEVLRKGGGALQLESKVHLVWSGDGRVVGALGISRDVTEQRRMQARVRLTERMASLGTLAAGVAHEVNNPLTYVLSNVGFALEQLGSAGRDPSAEGRLREAEQALREALTGADRVRHIVRDLKTFSRPDGERLLAVDANAVVLACLQMTAHQTGARARVVRRLGDVPRVRATEPRLGQVVLNLLVNASQAIREGAPERNEIEVSSAVAPDGRVEIVVRDSGEGISPEVLPRIFDPFFTTKAVGEGTGLGLSICHGIVKAMGGEIRVESSPGHGTAFRVLLVPARDEAGAAPGASASTDPGRPARRRVLVVDDDPLVGRAVARMIGDAHAVDVTTDPNAALQRISAGERWDVVLCDLMMPGVSGQELHARVRGIDAALAARIVFVTGGAFTASAREFLATVPNRRLEKPIDAATLRRVLAADDAASPGT